MSESIECPICHQKMKSLNSHIIYVHDMSVEEFRKYYPDCQMQIDCRKKGNYDCEICGRHYDYHNCLQTHMKKVHPEHFHKDEKVYEGKFECGMCGHKTNMLYNHVFSKHHMDWNVYCSKYNHDVNVKSFFTDEHKKCLSKNKKKFYQSDKGKQLRDIQSLLYSGESNPSKNIEVRSKISASAVRRMQEETFHRFNMRGLTISFTYCGKKYHCRSFEEFKVIHLLLVNNIDFKYESITLKYKDENGVIRRYILDFSIENDLIEIKTDNRKIDYYAIHKYNEANKMLNAIGKQLIIINYNELCERYGLSPLLEKMHYDFLRDLIFSDNAEVWHSVNHGSTSRILEKIDSDFWNNKNIHVKIRSKINENSEN